MVPPWRSNCTGGSAERAAHPEADARSAVTAARLGSPPQEAVSPQHSGLQDPGKGIDSWRVMRDNGPTYLSTQALKQATYEAGIDSANNAIHLSRTRMILVEHHGSQRPGDGKR